MVEQMWVFLMIDDSGREGVITFHNIKTHQTIPAIATSEEHMKKLIPLAKEIALEANRNFRIAEFHFDKNVEIEDGSSKYPN